MRRVRSKSLSDRPRESRGPRRANSSAKAEVPWIRDVSGASPLNSRYSTSGSPALGVQLCPLHSRMDAALATVEAALGGTTLAEVLAEPTRSVPLCPFLSVKFKPRPATRG